MEPRRVVPRVSRSGLLGFGLQGLGVCVWWRKFGQNTEKNKLGQSRDGQSRHQPVNRLTEDF